MKNSTKNVRSVLTAISTKPELQTTIKTSQNKALDVRNKLTKFQQNQTTGTPPIDHLIKLVLAEMKITEPSFCLFFCAFFCFFLSKWFAFLADYIKPSNDP